ncbi:hypothetical protein [Vibrio barjaei]|uniref:hypothetical protein n=1 Tax=Vibrio barjaei TaxID=1676683 RepID=UPI00228473E7|nr:hypothetical protein [Vibrio barjaei]MCY9873824.1 hypothetical protein [Vibrio barjaei]
MTNIKYLIVLALSLSSLTSCVTSDFCQGECEKDHFKSMDVSNYQYINPEGSHVVTSATYFEYTSNNWVRLISYIDKSDSLCMQMATGISIRGNEAEIQVTTYCSSDYYELNLLGQKQYLLEGLAGIKRIKVGKDYTLERPQFSDSIGYERKFTNFDLGGSFYGDSGTHL